MQLLIPILALALPPAPSPQSKLAAAIKAGSLVWQFSGPKEVKALLGTPRREEKQPDGGLEALLYHYDSEFVVLFGRESGSSAPFGLEGYIHGKDRVFRRSDEPLVLRTATDLAKLRPFTGLQNVDASRTDLKAEGARLRGLPFDTLTRWPRKDKLPEGFDPSALLTAGRNPGLGLRALHARGKDGRGVDIAIIDQPLVADHVETEGRLHLTAELDVKDHPPEMHGPGVSSIAAGRTCGVAPGANLYYIAMPMWKSQAGNHYYIQALERLLELNRSEATHIRAVSISDGEFATAPQADVWKALLVRAEREGVLVITCDQEASRLSFGLLRPLPGGNREQPEGYTLGTIAGELLVPGDGRTFASQLGRAVYSYAPRADLSWAAPWLVGLAALGFQANPRLTPARVRAYLMKSATEMPYGRVANPAAFLELCIADPADLALSHLQVTPNSPITLPHPHWHKHGHGQEVRQCVHQAADVHGKSIGLEALEAHQAEGPLAPAQGHPIPALGNQSADALGLGELRTFDLGFLQGANVHGPVSQNRLGRETPFLGHGAGGRVPGATALVVDHPMQHVGRVVGDGNIE